MSKDKDEDISLKLIISGKRSDGGRNNKLLCKARKRLSFAKDPGLHGLILRHLVIDSSRGQEVSAHV